MAHQQSPSAGLTIKINKHNLRLIQNYFAWVTVFADAGTRVRAVELLPLLFHKATMQISGDTLTLLYHFFVYATTKGNDITVAKTWELIIIVDDEGEGKLDPPPNGDPD